MSTPHRPGSGSGSGGARASAELFDLKNKLLRLEALYDLGRALASGPGEEELLEEAAARAVPVLDAARGFAASFEHGSGSGSVAAIGLPRLTGPVAVASDPFVLDVCRSSAPLSRERTEVLGRPVTSVAGAALKSARGEPLGVLVVVDREARGGESPGFDPEDRRFLGSLAALVAPALEGVRRLKALAADVDRLREENRALKAPRELDEVLVGDSAPLRRAKEMIARAAASRASVLVRGESGTGKELAARLLHVLSPRRDGPFLAINCAAVPETLLEAELFGIERGVATGVEARIGKFELASGGTVFLDEIADAPLGIQAKLLRVLQEHEVERVGGRQRIAVDVRIVAATHADLREEIRRRRFREDLYWRLRVVEITLPPLRERREDVPRLAAHFLGRIASREGRPVRALTREAVAALLSQSFPGNVRELENILEGAVALSSSDHLEAGDLQLPARLAPGDLPSLPMTTGTDLESLERDHIRRVLASVGGNKSHAARILGINRRTLYRKGVA